MRKQAAWGAWAGCFLAVIAAVATADDKLPPGGIALNDTSTLYKADNPGLIIIKSSSGDFWNVMVNRDTEVNVEGTAQADYLRPGVSVRFFGEMDKKGVLKGEVQELQIYTPAKTD